MATRSRIGIQLADKSVLSVYHHWDGYPEWLGRILKTHYNTKDKVAELIDGGDMSCCWTQIAHYGESTGQEYGPEYYSQRGEDCPPRFDDTIYDYLADGEEYAYLFVNNEWVCYELHPFSSDDALPNLVEIPTGALAV